MKQTSAVQNFVFRRYNKILSPWMTDSVIKDLYNLRAKKHGIQSQATPLIKRLNGGPFLGRILRNFLRFANGTLNPDVRILIKTSGGFRLKKKRIKKSEEEK